MVDCGKRQEDGDSRSDSDIDERLGIGQSGAWGSCRRCGRDRDGEVARAGHDQRRLDRMEGREPEVPSAEVGRALFGQLDHEDKVLVTC